MSATVVIEWRALAPVLLVLIAGILGILAEAVVPKAHRFFAQVFLTVASIAVALFFVVTNWRRGLGGPIAMGSMMLDQPTYFIWGALLVFGLMAILIFAERQVNGGVSTFAASAATVPGSRAEAEASAARLEHTEVFPLALFALAGMMVFPASSDLITMFVALEVLSLPLYLMCGMARRRRLLSQEAALKYFLLGAFSSAFFLFGVALLYGYAGSFDLSAIATAVQNDPGHWLHGDLHQDGRRRCHHAGVLRGTGRRALVVATAAGGVGGGHHGGRRSVGPDPDRHQAHPCLQLDRPCRLHHDRGRRRQCRVADQPPRLGVVRAVLPGRVRIGQRRGVRDRHHGAHPVR